MITATLSKTLEPINAAAYAGHGIAVGNDLVHLPAFNRSFTLYFMHRGYTQSEIAYCEQFADCRMRYASTWAAKEAVYKAVKQVDDTIKIWWRDIEIHRPKPQGKPTVTIKKLANQLDINLTISHDGEYVWALAVCMYPKEMSQDTALPQ